MQWQVDARANRLWHKKSGDGRAGNFLVILGLAGSLSGCTLAAPDDHQGLLESCLSDIACLEFAAATSPMWLPLVEGTSGSSAEANDAEWNMSSRRVR